jgi:hypothetical protein
MAETTTCATCDGRGGTVIEGGYWVKCATCSRPAPTPSSEIAGVVEKLEKAFDAELFGGCFFRRQPSDTCASLGRSTWCKVCAVTDALTLLQRLDGSPGGQNTSAHIAGVSVCWKCKHPLAVHHGGIGPPSSCQLPGCVCIGNYILDSLIG